MKPDRQPIYALVQLVAGASMISFSPVFVKLAHVGPTMAGFYRMLFGGVILLLLSLGSGTKLWHGTRHLGMILLCSIFFSLDLTFWHRSVHYVGPGLSTLLTNFQVFFLAGYGILVLGERVDFRLVISILLGMSGLYLIVGVAWDQFDGVYKLGIYFGLFTALCYTAYLIALRKLQALKPAAAMGNITLISLCTSLIMGFEGWLQREGFGIPDLQSWGALVGYGLVGQALGWVLISRAILKMEASRVGLILLLQPTLAFLWDILFFGRPTTPVVMFGALITLLAIYLGTTRQGSPAVRPVSAKSQGS
jgi:drug/metabolite transporter (DMT)-like permease